MTSSVLVIAVENLGFHAFSCGTEDTATLRDFAGFKIFCEESVRFTHAYAPSTMSQASLASIMTGRYPFEHGVWHNGSQFLSAHVRTVAEVAIQQNYRTSFFSGGPPIWRKSGLAQGFEVFEDNIQIWPGHPHRPVRENFEEFLLWLNKDTSRDAFFSVVYVPDLQFPGITTTNNLGEIREKSLTGQLRELGESLGSLIGELKALGRWDDTHVMLLGLNGRTRLPRPNENDAYDLYSESVQVALYIKPARKKRDLGIEWKIDQNVSLVDVGVTLFDFFGFPPAEENIERLPVVSLRSVLDKPHVTWDSDRILMVESGWPQWRGVGGSRFSLRRGNYLVLYDEKVKIFNTLIDRQEISVLSRKDPLYVSLGREILSSLEDKGFLPWKPLPQPLIEKLELGKHLWRANDKSEEQSKRLIGLSRLRPWDQQLWGWKAILALRERNWKWLKVLGQRNRQEIWEFVARQNLGQKYYLSPRDCHLAFLFGTDKFRSPSVQDCDNEALMSLLNWVEEKDSNLKAQKRDVFFRLYSREVADREIAEWNYVNSLKWDVNVDQPKGPSLVELFLALPRHRKYSRIVSNRISREY